MTFYSQGHQGLPCELRQPAMLEQDKDATDDDTGNLCPHGAYMLVCIKGTVS